MKRTRPSQAGKARQLRQALIDAQRERAEVVFQLSDANRRVIDALLAGNAVAAMAAKDREYNALCERDRLSDLIGRLQLELDRLGGKSIAPNMRLVGRRAPGLMRAAVNSLVQPVVTR